MPLRIEHDGSEGMAARIEKDYSGTPVAVVVNVENDGIEDMDV